MTKDLIPGHGEWYTKDRSTIEGKKPYHPDDELDPTGTGETPEEAAGRMSHLFEQSQTPVS